MLSILKVYANVLSNDTNLPLGFAFVPYCFLKKTPIFLHKAKKEKAADDRFYAVNMGQTTLFRSW